MTSRPLHAAAALAAALLLGGGAAFAQSPAEQDPPAVEAAISPGTGTVSSLSPARAATASVGETAADAARTRDPFWPTGYAPRPVLVETKAAAPLQQVASPPPIAANWNRALERLNIQGIVGGRNGKFFATVNNKVVEAGDEVSATFDGMVYRWKIRSIGKSGLVTEPLNVRPER